MANSSGLGSGLVTRQDVGKNAPDEHSLETVTTSVPVGSPDHTLFSDPEQAPSPDALPDVLLGDPARRPDSGQNLSNFTASSHPGSKQRVIAACRSLGAIGYADTPLDQIHLAYRSTQRWFVSVQRFLDDPDCVRFFPLDIPSLQDIHRLATLHDKPVRPPKRFITGAYGEHTKRRTPRLFREAMNTAKSLEERLGQHRHWIRPTIPADETTLEAIEVVLSKRRFNRWTGMYRQSVKLLSRHMSTDVLLSRAIVSGNMEHLHELITDIYRFNEHVLYKRQLGPAFTGIHTPWHELAVQIGYSQTITDVVQSPDVAANIVSDWHLMGEKLYALARLASPASRRGRKLSRLASRLYPVDHDINHMLQCSQKSAARLSLWVKLLRAAEPESNAYRHLTPRQILQSVTGSTQTDDVDLQQSQNSV